MSAAYGMSTMRITVEDRGPSLRERLDRASRLWCNEHHQAVVAVSIHARENGWFDSTWTTCCEGLERQAAAILKDRC